VVVRTLPAAATTTSQLDRDTRSNRIVKIKANIQTRTVADPPPDNLRKAPFMTRADVRTHVSQVGEAVACSGDRRWRFARYWPG
jgi:hypothetical protein